MRSSKVGVERGPSPDAVPRFAVAYHMGALALSVLVSCLIVAMPFEAYISETLPWATALPVPHDFSNLTRFNQTALAMHQALYTRSTLPLGAPYYFDASRNAHVCRHVISTTSPLLFSELPGVLFYGRAMLELLQAFANDTGASSSWHGRGTCVVVSFIAVPLSHQCIWLSSGNDLTNTTHDDFTLTYALTQYPYPVLVWFKFTWRLGTTAFLLLLLWRRYYSLCKDMATALTLRGHRDDLARDALWHYVVVLGDPTAPLALDAYVVTAFFVDFSLSPHMVAVAVLRLLQVDDLWATLKAALYLRRMVWFACFALTTTNAFLKRYHLERFFLQVDPTLQTVVPSFLTAYQYLLWCLFPTTYAYRIEVAIVGSAYIVIIAMAPLLYGAVGLWRRQRPSTMRYSSARYNALTSRLLLSCIRPLQMQDERGLGGSIHALCEANARYKALPVINTGSSDCFVLCYCNHRLEATLRLTLVEYLDLQSDEPHLCVVSGVSTSRFNELEQPSRQASNEKLSRPRLLRARSPSPWCL
ncbi:hypothetical protein SPRG_05591 [Saprolegnia parasitica CBS 223.65]|uniref:Uncharacterized protein n=1 Tax=Saprolegnia parasitica (strain CBS 223.65) TaxID=695850 RepID=A0A067CFW7_SAPPC|nr:hypothetical protein SPRG_05591 [Saprolegnia parasitica CBS 223.65]KDO29639.1 hypothetical protein SPRG_05591 [Saprolegnia parasitica CBS 223.65]|eukprot:XP_012199698.1 hypothetical protein SPRG_05591 [Saprolegnia parasitica CBS 223.65]